jgi:hypothetical protein
MYRTVNSEILQETAAFLILKDSGALQIVWTQLTFCQCATDQYYCYCQLTESTENIVCTLKCEMAECGKGTRKASVWTGCILSSQIPLQVQIVAWEIQQRNKEELRDACTDHDGKWIRVGYSTVLWNWGRDGDVVSFKLRRFYSRGRRQRTQWIDI